MDLGACQDAMIRTTLAMDLQGLSPIKAFALGVHLHPETVLRFMRGKQVGPTSVGLILRGLGLELGQVLERAS